MPFCHRCSNSITPQLAKAKISKSDLASVAEQAGLSLTGSQIPEDSFFFVTWLILSKEALHRGSYMSAHVLLISLNELGGKDKMRGITSLINSIIQEHECKILFII